MRKRILKSLFLINMVGVSLAFCSCGNSEVQKTEETIEAEVQKAVTYEVDTEHNVIVVTQADGSTTMIGSEGELSEDYYMGGYVDGPVENARFDHPWDVVADVDGTIYVADTGNHAIRKISKGRVSTIAGGYLAGEDEIHTIIKPVEITLEKNTLLVKDDFLQEIFEIDLTPVCYTDITEDAWYANAVYFVTEAGIMHGTEEGTFLPDQKVGYADFIYQMSRLHLYRDSYAVIGSDETAEEISENLGITVAEAIELLENYMGGAFPEDIHLEETEEQLSRAQAAYLFFVAADM